MVGTGVPTPNRPHATGSLRSCLSAARRAGMRLTPAKAPERMCEGCAAVRRIPARMVVSVTRTRRGRRYPADPSRVPVFHLAHFGTGTIDVGPAFSGRDRGRGEAAHGTCTRYLHVAARCAWPTFPRTRLSPGLPGIRPPAPDPVGPAVRVAGSRGVSMRHGGAGGDKLRSHPTPGPPIPYLSGLTGGSLSVCLSLQEILRSSRRMSGGGEWWNGDGSGAGAQLCLHAPPTHAHENGPLMRQRPVSLSQ